jgi:hypothetical protein
MNSRWLWRPALLSGRDDSTLAAGTDTAGQLADVKPTRRRPLRSLDCELKSLVTTVTVSQWAFLSLKRLQDGLCIRVRFDGSQGKNHAGAKDLR